MFSPSSRNFVINAIPFLRHHSRTFDDNKKKRNDHDHEIALILVALSSFLNGSLMPELLMMIRQSKRLQSILKLASHSSTAQFATEFNAQFATEFDLFSGRSYGRKESQEFVLHQLHSTRYCARQLQKLSVEGDNAIIVKDCLPLVGPGLTNLSLRISPSSNLSQQNIIAGLSCCRSLEIIDMTFTGNGILAQHTLETIWAQNPMKYLNLFSLRLEVTASDLFTIKVEPAWMPRLKTLQLDYSIGFSRRVPQIDDDGVSIPFIPFDINLHEREELERLFLLGQVLVNDENLSWMFDQDLKDWLDPENNTPKSLPRLTTLSIVSLFPTPSIDVLCRLFDRLAGSKLTDLYIFCDYIPTNEALEKITAKFPLLHEFNEATTSARQRSSPTSKNESLKSIATNLQQLKKLQIRQHLCPHGAVSEKDDEGMSLLFSPSSNCSRTLETLVVSSSALRPLDGSGWFPAKSSEAPTPSSIYRLSNLHLDGLKGFDALSFCDICFNLSHCLKQLRCPESILLFSERKHFQYDNFIASKFPEQMKELQQLEFKCNETPHHRSILGQLCKRSPKLDEIELNTEFGGYFAVLATNYENTERKALSLKVHLCNDESIDTDGNDRRLEDNIDYLTKITSLHEVLAQGEMYMLLREKLSNDVRVVLIHHEAFVTCSRFKWSI